MIYVLLPLVSFLLAAAAWGVAFHNIGKIWAQLAFGPMYSLTLDSNAPTLNQLAFKGFCWLCAGLALLVAGAWFWGL